MVGSIHHFKQKRKTLQWVLRDAEERLKLAIVAIEKAGELTFREHKSAQDVVELFIYRQNVKNYKKKQLKLMKLGLQSGVSSSRRVDGDME